MLSPTCDSEAKWNTACQGPSASTASNVPVSARSATISLHARRHRAAMAGAQIVQHHDGVAALDQCGHKVAADITRPAGDQEPLRHYLHSRK